MEIGTKQIEVYLLHKQKNQMLIKQSKLSVEFITYTGTHTCR